MKNCPNRPSHLAIAYMVAHLVNGPATIADLADESGLSEQTVRGYIRALRRLHAVHIAGFEVETIAAAAA